MCGGSWRCCATATSRVASIGRAEGWGVVLLAELEDVAAAPVATTGRSATLRLLGGFHLQSTGGPIDLPAAVQRLLAVLAGE